MTAKDYLSRVYKLQKKIERMELRYQEYEEMASSVSSPNYSGIRTDGTKSFEAPFVKWIEKAMDLGKDIEKEKAKLDATKAEVICVIEQIENEDYKSVLSLRYLRFMTWEDIAGKLYVTKRTTLRWHGIGLEETEKILQKKLSPNVT
jgi:hypothetical protein